MPRRKQPAIPDELLDQLLAGSDPRAALADGGLLDGLKKALAERALNAELDPHLETGEADGHGNSRRYHDVPGGPAAAWGGELEQVQSTGSGGVEAAVLVAIELSKAKWLLA